MSRFLPRPLFSSFFALSCLPLGTVAAQESTVPEDTPVRSVAELVARMQKAEARFDRVAAEIQMNQVIDMRGRFEGGQKIEATSRVRFELLRERREGQEPLVYARMRTEQKGPAGLNKLAVVRNPSGAFIHEANEMGGERWLHVPPELLERLEKAERVLGGDSMQIEGKLELGSFLGAALLEGLSGAYELSLEAPVQVGDATCEHVVGRLKQESGGSGLLGRGRPDRVDVYVDRGNWLLRRMVHSLSGEALYRVELLVLDTNARLAAADFVMQPEGGATFEDIRKDPYAEASIRNVLERLQEWEQRQVDAKGEGEQKPPATEPKKD